MSVGAEHEVVAVAKPPAIALKRLTGRTTSPYAKIPITIDGTPLSTSAANRTIDVPPFELPEFVRTAFRSTSAAGLAFVNHSASARSRTSSSFRKIGTGVVLPGYTQGRLVAVTPTSVRGV